jgi:hypothetical protein
MGCGKSRVMRELNSIGVFPLSDFVAVDPDFFKTFLPEWLNYVKFNQARAGAFTRLETGYIAEIAVEAGMQAGRNIWIDGSLRDTEWHKMWFMKLRKFYPNYRIAIVYVSVTSIEIPIARAAKRAVETGRAVPVEDIKDSFERVKVSVEQLRELCDLQVTIMNDSEPVLLEVWKSKMVS